MGRELDANEALLLLLGESKGRDAREEYAAGSCLQKIPTGESLLQNLIGHKSYLAKTLINSSCGLFIVIIS